MLNTNTVFTIFLIAVKLPWLFLGAPLTFNGAPGNIQGNIGMYEFVLEMFLHDTIYQYDVWSVINLLKAVFKYQVPLLIHCHTVINMQGSRFN